MSEEREELRRLKKLFHASFSEKMRLCGFDRHGGGMYYEKTEFGRKGVMILDNFRFGALQISGNMTITLTDVEKLLFEYRTTIRGDQDERKPNLQTISQNLGNIKIGIFRWWNNYNDADVEETLNAIEGLVMEVGLSFLETVDTPEKALNQMLATTKRKTKLGHPSFWYQKAFALMLLQKRRDLFDEYLPIFEKYAQTSGVAFSDFARFRDWIDSSHLW
jgi:hypothetical protein